MKLFKILMLFALLANPALSFAQGSGSVGGGRFTEAQLKDFTGELVKFFRESESKDLFPEVVEWERVSAQNFADFLSAIEPKVVNQKVYDQFGEERDCVSKILDAGKRIFECNAEKIPENRLENQPLIYQLIAHEGFVHAGIERPTSPELPSTYEKSSRFGNTKNLSLVTYQKWVPKLLINEDDAKLGIQCEFRQRSDFGKSTKGLSIVIQAYENNARLVVIQHKKDKPGRNTTIGAQVPLDIEMFKITMLGLTGSELEAKYARVSVALDFNSKEIGKVNFLAWADPYSKGNLLIHVDALDHLNFGVGETCRVVRFYPKISEFSTYESYPTEYYLNKNNEVSEKLLNKAMRWFTSLVKP